MKPHVLAALLGAALSGSVQAAVEAPGDSCFRFSDQRETVYRGGQQLLIRDQDRHYRVSLAGRQCDAIPAAAKLRLHSAGEANTLCAGSGRVSARSGSCRVAGVEEIDAVAFAQEARRRR